MRGSNTWRRREPSPKHDMPRWSPGPGRGSISAFERSGPDAHGCVPQQLDPERGDLLPGERFEA
jgi:hypothetical protein